MTVGSFGAAILRTLSCLEVIANREATLKIRQHSEARGPDGRCKHCGALPGPNDGEGFGDQQCVEREDRDNEGLKPEPKRRQMAADDFDTISDSMKKIEETRMEAVNKEESQ